MKTILFAFAAGCIPALAVTNGANAQSSNNIAALEKPGYVFKMNNDFSSEKNNTVNLNSINARAIKDFNKSYKMASDAKWYKTRDGFIAGFTLDGINNTIYYAKNGQWKGSLKCYSEDKLAAEVRHIVKREYYDYKITCVKEIETINTYGTPTYIVNLEDDNNIKVVRVNDGNMDVYEEFSKK